MDYPEIDHSINRMISRRRMALLPRLWASDSKRVSFTVTQEWEYAAEAHQLRNTLAKGNGPRGWKRWMTDRLMQEQMVRAQLDEISQYRNPDTCVTCGSRFDARTPIDWQCPDCEAKA